VHKALLRVWAQAVRRQPEVEQRECPAKWRQKEDEDEERLQHIECKRRDALVAMCLANEHEDVYHSIRVCVPDGLFAPDRADDPSKSHSEESEAAERAHGHDDARAEQGGHEHTHVAPEGRTAREP
jgi:hypothetical protein